MEKKSSTIKWVIALVLELLILGGLVYGYYLYYVNEKVSQIQTVELDETKLHINEGANAKQDEYTNIALFGIDARNNESMAEGYRSDTIMILSINNSTKEVKLVSVYRDSLFRVANGQNITAKVNAAYAYGGPELAIATLNENLDLNITDFVTVNFMSLTKAIDDLGGITVNVKNSELPVLNSAITEQIEVTGIYSDGVWETGEVTLNGTQATAYARVRSTDQGDITRTQRQRYVVTQMINKTKSSDLATIDKVIDDIFPNILTSLTKDEIKDYLKSMSSYNLTETIGFPMAYGSYNSEQKGSCLAPADMTANVTALHEFLFGTTDYTPTNMVQGISSAIISETGIVYSGEPIVIDTKLLGK